MSEIGPVTFVGRRIVVTGLAGAGKSTFSRALAARTGLPMIHLDVHFWRPGWVEPPEHEWREEQRELLAGEAWIADGNYDRTLDMRLERADTVVFLDTPWWICAARAFARGLRRRPVEFELPEGCDETAGTRLRAEWRLVGAIWHNHRSEREQELAIVSQHGRHAALHMLRSKRAVHEFLDGISVAGGSQPDSKV
jgi:adenylate kinase family enzyme